MGRDIHLYLEIDADSGSRFSTPEAFAKGRIHIPRDYRLFQALAGLARVDDRHPPPLIAPRGLPDPCSNDVAKDFYMPIRFPGEEDPWGPFEAASVEQATRWVEDGKSVFADSPVQRNALVSNPDWHTPSWLFEREIAAALDHVGHAEHEVSLEFRAVQALLRYFDGQLGRDCARIVFWFDN